MTIDGPASLMKRYWASVSRGELSKLAGYFAPDAKFEDVALGHFSQGREYIADVLAKFFSQQPCRFDVENILEDGEAFAAQWIVSGVHTAELMQFPAPTGREFRYRGVSVGIVRNGLIIQKSDYWNVATMLEQLTGETSGGDANR